MSHLESGFANAPSLRSSGSSHSLTDSAREIPAVTFHVVSRRTEDRGPVCLLRHRLMLAMGGNLLRGARRVLRGHRGFTRKSNHPEKNGGSIDRQGQIWLCILSKDMTNPGRGWVRLNSGEIHYLWHQTALRSTDKPNIVHWTVNSQFTVALDGRAGDQTFETFDQQILSP